GRDVGEAGLGTRHGDGDRAAAVDLDVERTRLGGEGAGTGQAAGRSCRADGVGDGGAEDRGGQGDVDLVVGSVVRADLEVAAVAGGAADADVEQLLPAEGGRLGDPVQLTLELRELGLRRGLRLGVLRTTVGGLNGEVTH